MSNLLPPVFDTLPTAGQMPLANAPLVSFIVPVYNEVDNVVPLVQELTAVGEQLPVVDGYAPYEIILVDDGSRDGTVEKLRKLVQSHPLLRVVCLKRNYGQTPATSAGFQQAQGKYIVTLDGDLQNDPASVPDLVRMMESEPIDIISGWRKNRQDTVLTRKLPSAMANWLIASLTGVKIHDNGCSLKVYRSEVAKEVPLYGEMHRFIPALASIDGAVIKEVPVAHRARLHGTSKYNLSRTFKVILDLMTVIFMKRFFTRPLHMFGRVGFGFLAAGSLIEAYLAFEKLAFQVDIGTRPLMFLGILLIVTGIQLISTGLIAEIQVRTYFESQGKAIYKVREVLQSAGT
jgi:glycosyltransferase involved in cell wall biosynthesis